MSNEFPRVLYKDGVSTAETVIVWSKAEQEEQADIGFVPYVPEGPSDAEESDDPAAPIKRGRGRPPKAKPQEEF